MGNNCACRAPPARGQDDAGNEPVDLQKDESFETPAAEGKEAAQNNVEETKEDHKKSEEEETAKNAATEEAARKAAQEEPDKKVVEEEACKKEEEEEAAAKTAEEAKAMEDAKAAEEAKAIEDPRTTEEAKATEDPKAAEEAKAADDSKVEGEKKKAESAKSTKDADAKKKAADAKKKAHAEEKKKAHAEAKKQAEEAKKIQQWLEACMTGNLKKARALLKDGVNVEVTDEAGYTGLMLGAKHGHEDLVGGLAMEKKVKLNQVHKTTGDTALHIAAQEDHKEVCVVLVRSKGIQLKVKNKLGRTPVEVATGQLATWMAGDNPAGTYPPWQGRKM